jgi:RNA polymerase sigma factor (sigma-70 family)
VAPDDPTPKPRMLQGDEADIYRTHSAPLRAAVRRAVLGPDAIIDDACSYAWLQLMRHQPDRGPTLFAWLRTVAIHAGWDIAQREAREPTSEHLPGELEPRRGDLSPELQAREALRALADLPDRQRTTLTLLISGHSYREIAAHQHLSHTAVNKALVRARKHLRLVHDDS